MAYCSQGCQSASWAFHKIICKRPNYVIKFHLHPDKIADPPVVRTLSCPSDADFYELHASLQLAFGWAAIHSFDFAVVNPSYSQPAGMMQIIQHQRMQAMNGGKNQASTTPEYLLRITDPLPRTQFSGVDRMHEGSRRHPQTREKKADEYKLYQLFDDAKWEGKKIVYTYDFGDNWEHFLTVEGRSDATGEFEVLSGTGHHVAEDVGSFTGWEELKAAYRARSPTSEQKEKRSWFEKMAANCDPRGLTGNRVSLFENRDEINWNMRSDHIEDYFEKHRQQHAGRRLARLNWLTGQR